MQKLSIKELNKKHKPNPIFKGMPSSLKDPKNFEEVEKQLTDVLKSDHKHATAKAYVKCAECNAKRLERQNIMKEIGFKSINQYFMWRKIMGIIINKKDFQLR